MLVDARPGWSFSAIGIDLGLAFGQTVFVGQAESKEMQVGQFIAQFARTRAAKRCEAIASPLKYEHILVNVLRRGYRHVRLLPDVGSDRCAYAQVEDTVGRVKLQLRSHRSATGPVCCCSNAEWRYLG